jgi:hypothetical protein
MSVRLSTVGAVLIVTAFALPCAAQGVSAASAGQTCDQKDAAAKRAWASEPHGWLASVFHKEQRDIADSWCRIWEASGGRDRSFKAENFGRTLFTGEGIHPAVSSALVPGSGFAGGATFGVDRALASRPLRLSVSADALASTNGSWQAGGGLTMLGSARKRENDHNHAVIDVHHQQLAELTYFGPSNHSNKADQTAYALSKTIAAGLVIVPLRSGFSAEFAGGGEWLDPGTPTAGSQLPVDARFTERTAPALTASTSYFIYGAGARWRYPLDATSGGYRTSAEALLRAYHATSGGPYSFRRLDLSWTNAYTPNDVLGTFFATGFAALSYTGDGDTVPFYLQPTVGGTDQAGRAVLRSYHDYRFRAPNALGVVIEHQRTIKDFFGSLLFVDLGQVFDTPSRVRLNDFHKSFGAGVTLRAGNTTVLRIFYAWGGGEGTRTTFSGGSGAFSDAPLTSW